MITLATDNPTFEQRGDMTVLKIPSGDGAPVEVALTRHQLCHLMKGALSAVDIAFDTRPHEAEIVALHRKAGAL